MEEQISIEEMAIKGLNDRIIKVIKKYKIPKNAKILVLGCGKGAIEYKLLSEEYKDITSVDYFTDFKLKDKCKFIKLDLNSEKFSEYIKKKSHKKYDLILSVEVIEHLYNPYNFLTNIKELLLKDGIAIISTPNTQSYLSRVDYLLTGYPTFFTANVELGGHVSPIFHKIFKFYLNNTDLEIIEHTFYGSLFLYLNGYEIYSFKSVPYLITLFLLYYLLQILMVTNRKIAKGTNSIYVIRHKK